MNKSKYKIILGISSLIVLVCLIIGVTTVLNKENNTPVDKYVTSELIENVNTLEKDQMEELARKTVIVGAKDFDTSDSGALHVEQSGNVYTLIYNSSKEAKEAYTKYMQDDSIIFCELDTPLSVTDTEHSTNGGESEEFVNEINGELENILYDSILINEEFFHNKNYDTTDSISIAVIDSGAPSSYTNGYNAFDGSSNTIDTVGHGTSMINTIDGLLSEYKGYYTIIPIKVANDEGYGSVAALINAFEYISESNMDVDVINISMSSLNTSSSSVLSTYISKFTDHGINVIVSAGNNNQFTDYYVPAKISQATVVGSATIDGKLQDFSNYGDSVDYIVTSNSTSEAAAKMTGLYSYALLSNKNYGEVLRESGITWEYTYDGLSNKHIAEECNDTDALIYDGTCGCGGSAPADNGNLTFFMYAKLNGYSSTNKAITLGFYIWNYNPYKVHTHITSYSSRTNDGIMVYLTDNNTTYQPALSSMLKLGDVSISSCKTSVHTTLPTVNDIYANNLWSIGTYKNFTFSEDYITFGSVNTPTFSSTSTYVKASNAYSVSHYVYLFSYWKYYSNVYTEDDYADKMVLHEDLISYYKVNNGAYSSFDPTTKYFYKSDYASGDIISVYRATKYTGKTSSIATYTMPYYKLTLDANGGSATNTSYTMGYKKTDNTSVNVATRTGYKFKGWYTASSGGTQVFDVSGKFVKDGTYWTSSGTWGKYENVTLYAQWEPNKYTVTIDPNGGTYYESTGNSTSGYQWVANTAKKTLSVSHNSSGYVSYNVTKDEIVNSSYSSVISYTGVAITKPTKVGNTFKEWKITSGSGTFYTANAYFGIPVTLVKPTSDVTVQAQWTIHQSTLTINPNGGTWGGSTSSQSFTQNYNTTKTIANPTRTGYIFNGWTLSSTFTAGSLSGTTFTFGATNGGVGTLTASWTPISVYTITLNQNGGSGGTSVFYEASGVGYYFDKALSQHLPNNGDEDYFYIVNPTKANSRFNGYYTAPSGGTVYIYSDGSFDKGEFNTFNQDMTLYARWETDTITFNTNGGVFSNGATTKTAYTWYWDSSLGTLSSDYIPTKEGYNFAGWGIDASSNLYANRIWDASGKGIAHTSGTRYFYKSSNTLYWYLAQSTNNNITVYAQWTPKESTINIDLNNGKWNNYAELGQYVTVGNTTYNGTEYFGIKLTDKVLSDFNNDTFNVWMYFYDEYFDDEWVVDIYFDITNGIPTFISEDGDYPSSSFYVASTKTYYVPFSYLQNASSDGYGFVHYYANGVDDFVSLWSTTDDSSFSLIHIYCTSIGIKLFNQGAINTNYTFNSWTTLNELSKTVSANNIFVQAKPGDVATVTANWTPNIYDYKVNHYLMNLDGTTYTLKETDTGSLNYGSSLTGELNGYTGFTAPAEQTITISTSGNTINYYYTRNKYWVTLTAGTGINSVTGAGTYYYEQSVTVEAALKSNTAQYTYGWSKWSGTSTSTNQKYTFTMPASDVDLTANGTQTVNQYTQKVQVRYENADGTFTAYTDAINKKYNYGDTVSWSRVADTTYKAASITSYTVTADKTTQVTVYRNTYTVTLNKGTGINSVSGAGTYRVGQSVSIDVTLKTNTAQYTYGWTNWTGTYTLANKASSFEMPASNVTLTANGTQTVNKYKQVVQVRYENADGTFTDYTDVINDNYNYGSSVSWSRAADTTYKAASITTYSVTAAKTTQVTVYRNTYTVKIIAGTGIKSVTGDGTYRVGQSVTVKAVLKDNTAQYTYGWTNWTGTSTSTNQNYTFEMPAKNVTLTANGTQTVNEYTQIVQVRYEKGDGTFTEYEDAINKKYKYGDTVSWLREEDDTYKKASITSYTVTEAKTTQVTVYRQQYTVTLAKGTGISGVSGDGTYRVGQSVTVGATLKSNTAQYTYGWNKWTGTFTSTNQTYTFTMPASDVDLTANGTQTLNEYTQIVQARYENADGTFTGYTDVINKKYKYGDTVSWSREADTTYKAASIVSYTVTGAKTTQVTIYRQTYTQVVQVRYENADGTFTDYENVINSAYRYGATVSWSRAADKQYKSASVSYSVTEAKTTKITVYRQTYTQIIKVRYENADGTFTAYEEVLNASYRYGDSISWSRAADTVYKAASITTYNVSDNKTTEVTVYRQTYTQVVKVRYENADGTFTAYENVINKAYRYGDTVSWSRAADAAYQVASLSYTVTGAKTTEISIYRNKVYFDINAMFEGIKCASLATTYKNIPIYFGTVDIYINGVLVQDNTTDFYSETLRYGSSIEITDIKANTGYKYNGIYEATGSAKGQPTLKFELTEYTTVTLKFDDEELPAIEYNVNTNWSVVDLVVSLKATDESGVAKLELLKGNTVIASWTDCSGVTKTTTLSEEGIIEYTIRATDNFNNIATRNFTVKIDKSLPVISANDTYGWYIKDTKLTFSASDNNSGMASIILTDENGNQLASGVNTISYTFSAEGEKKYIIKATDVAGNYNTKTITVKVDKTLPIITANSVYGWYIADTELTFKASDTPSGVKSFTLTDANGTVLATGTSEIKYKFSTEGANTYTLKAVDNAGNTSLIKTITVKIDKTNPTITANSEYGWYNTDTELSFKVSDTPSGVKSFTLTDSKGNLLASNTTEIKYVFGTQGINSYTLTAIDNAGRTTTKTITVKIDKEFPVIDASNTYGWYIADVTLGFKATDTVSGMQAFILTDKSGKVLASGTSEITYKFTAEGDNTYVLTAIDIAGNIITKTITVKIDKTLPVITFDKQSGNWADSHTIKITHTDTPSGIKHFVYAFSESASEPTSGWSSNITTASTNATISIDGQWYLHVKAYDVAGNSIYTKTTGVFKVDTTKPRILTTDIKYNINNVDITVTSTDYSEKYNKEGSGIYGYAITTNKTAPTTWVQSNKLSHTFNITQGGTYCIWVRDVKGNISDYVVCVLTTYEIEFINNYGGNTEVLYNIPLIFVGSNFTTPKAPENTTYNFINWNTSNLGIGQSLDQNKKYTLTEELLNDVLKVGYEEGKHNKLTMYGYWYKEVKLTFDLNGGTYNSSTSDIVLNGKFYNNVTSYTFDIIGGLTNQKVNYYDKQVGAFNSYGTLGVNGVNKDIVRKDIDGTTYRLLGWSTNINAKEPDSNLIVYNANHAKTYIISNNATLYAVWEPVLYVQVSGYRNLGTLTEPGITGILKVTTQGSTQISGQNYNGYITTVARPGEAIKYNLQFRGILNSVQVKVDPYISNMYDLQNPLYSDILNKVDVSNVDEVIPSDGYDTAYSSLNRLILNPDKSLTRQFYLPQYLGSELAEEASKKQTQYYVDYTFTNNDSFYYDYVFGKDEVVKVRQYIVLATSDSGTGEVDSVLNDLRTKLKIRLR